MSKEQVIQAWKNPELREGATGLPAHPAGKSVKELSTEELEQVQGASDVQPETTPACAVAFTIGATVIFSVRNCK